MNLRTDTGGMKMVRFHEKTPAAKQPRFSLAFRDEALMNLVAGTDHRTLATWAADCAGRVLHYFEDKFPGDPRPRNALDTVRVWIETEKFSMKVIRGASLCAHAAARQAGEDSPARSAARAAGQAVATAHVSTHATGAAQYALQAVHRAASPSGADAAVAEEREWQYRHLSDLSGNGTEEKSIEI